MPRATPLANRLPPLAVAASILAFGFVFGTNTLAHHPPPSQEKLASTDVSLRQPDPDSNSRNVETTLASERPKPILVDRAAVCSDIAAKIVSDARSRDGSLASLSLHGQRASVVHVGSHFGGREVLAIGYDRSRMSPSVLLAGKEGVCQAMTFEKAEPKSAKQPVSRHNSRRAAQSSQTEILVERSAMDAIFERSLELTQGIRVVPDMRDGAVTGFRLFGVRPESLAATFGFRNGDTIQRVNGVALNSAEAALSLYSLMRSLQHFDVDVNRNGKPARIAIRVN